MMKTFSLNGAMIVMSVVMMAEAKSWLIMWMMMELNMVGMMIQLMSEMKKEKIVLFLVFQSLPAMALLMYLSINKASMDLTMSAEMVNILLVSMACKIGLFPLHSWALKMSKSISWSANLMMMTWQKIIPLIMMMKISWGISMKMTALASMAMMGVYLLNMVEFKSFMVASSLSHMSWIMFAMMMFYWVNMMYLAMYSTMVLLIVMKTKKKNKKAIINQMDTPISSMKVSMLSLGGMPPMLGFVAKSMVLMTMISSMESKWIVLMALMVASWSFYAYMQIMYKSMLLMKMSKADKKNVMSSSEGGANTTNMVAPSIYYA